jgi:hypothetical protein
MTPGASTTYVSLFASADARLDARDTPILSAPLMTKVGVGKAKTVKVKFTYPAVDGPVYLLARASASAAPGAAQGSADEVSAGATPVTVAPANAALNPVSLAASSTSLVRGKRGSATLLLTNGGNVPYKGTLAITLGASADGEESDDVPITALSKRLSVKPGATKRIKITFALPAEFSPNTFQLVAAVTPAPVAGVTVSGGFIADSQVVTVSG